SPFETKSAENFNPIAAEPDPEPVPTKAPFNDSPTQEVRIPSDFAKINDAPTATHQLGHVDFGNEHAPGATAFAPAPSMDESLGDANFGEVSFGEDPMPTTEPAEGDLPAEFYGGSIPEDSGDAFGFAPTN